MQALRLPTSCTACSGPRLQPCRGPVLAMPAACRTPHTPAHSGDKRAAIGVLGGSRAAAGRPCSHVARLTPFDQAWGTQIDGQSVASQFFAMSLLPYLGFLFFLTRSGKAPRLMLFGFYFLLLFVAATIPAGIYAKTHYGTSLANVDWLHGTAESLLTVTNLLIVLGLQQAITAEEQKKVAETAAAVAADADAAAQQAAAAAGGNGAGGKASVKAADAVVTKD